MKHKYLVWGSAVVVSALMVAGGYGLWRLHDESRLSATDLYGAGSDYVAATQSQTPAPDTGQTPAQGQTGTIASGNAARSGSTTSGIQPGTGNQAAGTSQDAAKLLDPTTFAQYDRYKNDAGAQYVDLQQGSGASLASGQTAAVYYRGWLTNGTLFDQSRTGSDGNLQTFNFKVGDHQVITGWEQGLVGMKVGGVRLLIVPPAAGYGSGGQGPVPSNAVLVFQVQLVAVQ